ncbi:helix-turn-helix domain-containing protein [Pedosphaera parvula]|uniref:helix-turn-helix domain-containing protein n=1 Tax=Pedosphaera parvula TaxID=1032527 RepID=UPI0009FCD148
MPPNKSLASPASHFQHFRERAGLSHAEVAQHVGVSSSCIWDIESRHDELASAYLLREPILRASNQ